MYAEDELGDGNKVAPKKQVERSQARRALWFIAGWLCFAIGAIGVALPGIPTTGPMILALACFSRSSRRFHDWLYEHPRFGPPLRHWRNHGIIPVRAKAMALGTMAASLVLLLLTSSLPPLALAGVAAFMACGAAFILRCPHRMPDPGRAR